MPNDTLIILGALVAGAVLVYLFVALLAPERLS